MLRSEWWIVVGAWALVACGPPREMTWPDTGQAETGVDATTDTGPRVDAGQHCAAQADCDDHIACTDDACVVGGVCEHVANDRLCPTGQVCRAAGCSAAASCTTNADCDDHVMCTRDVCAAGGMCQNVRDDSLCDTTQTCSATLDCVAMGRCGTSVDCDDGRFCNGMEQCNGGVCAPGTAPNCADSDPCTGDVCSDAMGMCLHPPVSPCGGVVTPGTYTLDMPPQYSCGAGSFGPVSQVTLSTSVSGVTITGFPVTLTGPAPSMGMFSARATQSMGSCQWTYSLSGSFTTATSFSGSWNVSFDFCSASLACLGRSGTLTGTLH